MAKERIDIVLARQGLAPSREKARILIMAGEVFIGTERITKADKKVEDDVPIEVRSNPIPYVSYGGVKLKGALDAFGMDVRGKKALDIGSSTGGFVDCLLQEGAVLVHAIDGGTHQLHERLRKDRRIILKENCNARYLTLEDVGEKVDLVTIDVSFISLKKILPVAVLFLDDDGVIISLVKPQFEVGRFDVGKGGIVKNPARIEEVLEDIKSFGQTLGLSPVKMTEAPREKTKKNKEYFIQWELSGNPGR